ncbi:IQ and ubiquitin-like domain-containing protein [Nephila pilipes]|uniref:IQ and ubiquitin-like domain-containing protein n=1 Tax=Nephila pilipes TaxID=299642 RepID=A0A8X6ILB9_NEPPI|nr:IQ and ubiquitin-like domain-containing protein [Nephila pilipes]
MLEEKNNQESDVKSISDFIHVKNEENKLFQSTEFNEEDKVLNITKNKRFLGGYRHKLTGKIYHHAVIQTVPSPWKYELISRYNRDAQTVQLQDKAQQTPKDASTQVQARNIYLNTMKDKILPATDNYIYADDIKKEYSKKIITLQSYIRGWLAFKELLRRKEKALLQILWDDEQIRHKFKEDTKWLNDLEKRRSSPNSDDDFRLIFSDLQKWWNSESKSISEVRAGADFKAATWLLINAEIAKIEEVNKRKNLFEQEKYFQSREKSLKIAAEPKMWKTHSDAVRVETSTTLRAKYVHELYQTLSMKYISPQDRVQALINLKEFLKPYHSKLTDNLEQLANREIDLHLRKVKGIKLEGLQTRIRNLFWQLAKRPTFNPEMQLVTKIKKNGISPLHIMSCASCKCFYILPTDSTDNVLGKSVIQNYSTKCKKCLNIENEAWIRKDLELYKRILKLLISEEEKMPTKSGIIYILQPSDIEHLVDKIWKHQSCIGGSKNDLGLELTRFDMDKNWTPWNCLLVTRQETAVLSKIPNSETKYDKRFKKNVFQKHAEARRYFSTIPRFLPYITNFFCTKENIVSLKGEHVK